MDHLIVQLGLALGGATLLAVLCKALRQSTIIAFIGIGVIGGLFRDVLHLPEAIVETFTELGIILLLFMAGLEVDIQSYVKRWRLVLINGLGQIVLVTLLGILLGKYYVGLEGAATLLFFALSLSVSSTIIVLGTLREHKAMESLHGQIILGLMVLQDITAVVALSVLRSFGGSGSLVAELLLIFAKMAVVIAVLALLSRYVLRPAFKHFARSSEMLFLGTLGYCMGVAALCELAHFFPEIGAFLAGASLAFLPYRLEIEDKVDPLKTFGVILFFITLGYNLKLDASLLPLVDQVLVLGMFVVVGKVLLMLLLGWLSRLKSRPAFMIGVIINQVSEFSLILATLAMQAGVFTQHEFAIVTLTTVWTIVLSTLGHQFMEQMYNLSHRTLGFIDRRSIPYQIQEEAHFEFEDHIVVLSYNEIAQEIADYYSQHGEKVLLIDIDPEIHAHFHGKSGHNLYPLYADMYDPEVWSEFHFDKARIIISAMIGGQEAELGIARWLQERHADVPFIASTDLHQEALELYEAGVRYVIQTELMAAERLYHLLRQEMVKGHDAFRDLGKAHYAKTKELEADLGGIFKLV